jgi:hypothetical protein
MMEDCGGGIMAKTNYTKVEEALAEGMRKIEVNRLLDIADERRQSPVATAGRVVMQDIKNKVDTLHLKRLEALHRELKALEKGGHDPCGKLKIDKAEIKRFRKDPTALTPIEWEKVKTARDQLATFKAKIEKKRMETSDDDLVNQDLVNQQRKKQVTKRFNINEKWIPLR